MDRCVGQWTSSCCDCVVKVCCMWNPAAVFEVWELILIRKYVCFLEVFGIVRLKKFCAWPPHPLLDQHES